MKNYQGAIKSVVFLVLLLSTLSMTAAQGSMANPVSAVGDIYESVAHPERHNWKQNLRGRGIDISVKKGTNGRSINLSNRDVRAGFVGTTPNWSSSPNLTTRKNYRGMDDFAWVEPDNLSKDNNYDARLELPSTYDIVYRCEGSKDNPRCVTVPEYESGVSKPYYRERDGKTILYMDHFSGGGGTTSTQSNWNTGSFDGASADRKDNSGQLGIGYLNGTNSGQSGNSGLNNGSLVGYWRLDTTSDLVKDYSGYGNDGSASSNVVRGSSGIFGTNASDFNDSNNPDVTVPSSSSLSFTDQITVSAWVKFSSFNSYNTVVHGHTNAGWSSSYWLAADGNSGWRFDIESSPGSTISVPQMSTGEWYHVVGTYDGSQTTLYLNGNQEGTGAVSNEITNENGVRFGRTSNPYPFDGTMDEVRVYDRALSSSEVEQLYFYGKNDNKFNGNYTSDKIDSSEKKEWDSVTVDANLPSNTNASLLFKALDSSGTQIDSQKIDLNAGSNQYPLSLNYSEDAEWTLFGYSQDAASTWEVNSVQTSYSSASCKPPDTGNWVISHFCNVTQSITPPANITVEAGGILNITSTGAVNIDLAENYLLVEKSSSGTYTQSEEQIQTQSDWNGGVFDGASADRKDNSGQLGIGYLNGSGRSTGLENGLVGYWRMDRASGEVVDYSGYGNGGSASTNIARGSPGVFGTNAFNFDDSNNPDVTVPSSSSLSFSDKITISTWVKLNEFGTYDTVIHGHTSDGWSSSYWLAVDSDTSWRFDIEGSSTGLSVSQMSVGEWYHVVATYDGSQAVIYLNGVQQDTASVSGTINNENGVRLGRTSNPYPFDGTMDEVRVYDRALSSSEVEQLYFYGSDGDGFNGNYISKVVGGGETHYWDKLNIDANIPDGTTATAVFKSLDSSENVVDQHSINLSDGDINYTISSQSSEKAEITLKGSSNIADNTWEINEATVYYEEGSQPGAKVLIDKNASIG